MQMYTFTISFQIYSENVMENMSFLFLFYIKTLILPQKGSVTIYTMNYMSMPADHHYIILKYIATN